MSVFWCLWWGRWHVFTGRRNVFQRQGTQMRSELVLIWLKCRLFTSLALPLFPLSLWPPLGKEIVEVSHHEAERRIGALCFTLIR